MLTRSSLRTFYHAFSLVELLVVMAIISLLAAILLPTLSESLHMARETSCVNMLKQVYIGVMGYHDDYHGTVFLKDWPNLPYETKWSWENECKLGHPYLEPYLGKGTMRCPASRPTPTTAAHRSYYTSTPPQGLQTFVKLAKFNVIGWMSEEDKRKYLGKPHAIITDYYRDSAHDTDGKEGEWHKNRRLPLLFADGPVRFWRVPPGLVPPGYPLGFWGYIVNQKDWFYPLKEGTRERYK